MVWHIFHKFYHRLFALEHQSLDCIESHDHQIAVFEFYKVLLILYESQTMSHKMGCVFQMVVVSILPYAEFGRNHREDALHFICHFWRTVTWHEVSVRKMVLDIEYNRLAYKRLKYWPIRIIDQWNYVGLTNMIRFALKSFFGQ